jgi:hypothetical protein
MKITIFGGRDAAGADSQPLARNANDARAEETRMAESG